MSLPDYLLDPPDDEPAHEPDCDDCPCAECRRSWKERQDEWALDTIREQQRKLRRELT